MIRIQDLTKYYDSLCALDHINVNVDQGEIVGLLGPNGAGKTTALRILTGYYRPTSGTVQIFNRNLDQDLLDIKKMIGYLPESIPLYRNMIVYDYLNYLSSIRKLEQDSFNRIKEISNLCGLKGVMHKSIGELSKGYQQRVGLAHALLHDPEILILDEPTSGLDPNQILEIRGLIRKIGREKTVILSTHILSEAEATCDRMVIIHQGKIVADGTPSALKADAKQGSTIRLTLKKADLSSVKSRLAPIQGIEEITPIQEDLDKIEFQIRCKPELDLREEIYTSIKSTDWIVTEFYQDTKTLENIFKELTQEPQA